MAALLQTSLIWVAGVVVLALLVIFAGIFVTLYSHPRERSKFVSVIVVLSLTSLLATVCLLPVDIALVSATTNNKTGLKKDWADPEHVNNILTGLKVVYYLLYSLDALMCLLVIPFTYFWYEEKDVDSTAGSQIKGALKYSIAFLALVVILFLIGFFIPVAKDIPGKHLDLDYFKRLLMESHGERALTFVVGVLLCIGTILYAFYTAPGIALFPISLIKSIPVISVASAQEARDALALNREHQRIIEARNTGGQAMSSKDRRELEGLQREERTLTRRQRLADEGKDSWWLKIQAFFRPFKMLFGFLLLVFSIVMVGSMLVTCIDKLRNSICGSHCGYILSRISLFNPMDWIMVKASTVFPIDYVLALLLVIYLFVSTVVGLAYIGIRFLWVTIFKIRSRHTKPQALLMGTILLTLTVLALNYALTMIIAPQYSAFGGQKQCIRNVAGPGSRLDCSLHPEMIVDCATSAVGHLSDVCTPTVVSTFLNRITLNFPFFGVFTFWAQFVFVGIFVITTITGLIQTPKMDIDTEIEDAEEAEEESLLAASRTRFRGAWDDVTGRTSNSTRAAENTGTA